MIDVVGRAERYGIVNEKSTDMTAEGQMAQGPHEIREKSLALRKG